MFRRSWRTVAICFRVGQCDGSGSRGSEKCHLRLTIEHILRHPGVSRSKTHAQRNYRPQERGEPEAAAAAVAVAVYTFRLCVKKLKLSALQRYLIVPLSGRRSKIRRKRKGKANIHPGWIQVSDKQERKSKRGRERERGTEKCICARGKKSLYRCDFLCCSCRVEGMWSLSVARYLARPHRHQNTLHQTTSTEPVRAVEHVCFSLTHHHHHHHHHCVTLLLWPFWTERPTKKSS